MIRNGYITYGASSTPLTTWELDNDFLNAALIAALSTILSYQMASIMFDIAFGVKSSCEARVRDLHVLLLSRQSSPLSVFSSLLRNDWLTRRAFGGEILGDDKIVRDAKRIKPGIMLKLFFLLAVVPILNIVSIVLSFEKKKTLSFREAQFGGLAIGINSDFQTVHMETLSGPFSIAMLKLESGDTSNVTLSLRKLVDEGPVPSMLGRASVLIWDSGTVISVAVIVNQQYTQVMTSGILSIRSDTQYFARTSASGDLCALIELGLEELKNECGFEDTSSAQDLDVSNTKFAKCQKIVACPGVIQTSNLQETIAFRLAERITFVDADNLEVFPNDVASVTQDIESVSAEDFAFLVRSRRFVGVPILAIATAVAVLVRVLARLCLNNDVEEGVHLLLKKRFGLLWWESLLLQGDETISYVQAPNEKEFQVHW